MAKIISYNLNGIRASLKKGLADWVLASKADVICFQEIKATPEQFDVGVFEQMGYHHYWYPAEKKGYSGVAILSKQKPDNVEIGCGIKQYDAEGRWLRADFGDVSVVSAYFPSGTSGDERQNFKYRFLDDTHIYVNKLKKKRPKLIISGDYNICHKAIDIHNPVSNAKSSGFLPEEREWLSRFIDSGFIDSFRHFNAEPHQYSWWSQRFNSRAKNLGWRIDYHMVSQNLEKQLKRAAILPEAKHSDHCPILVEVDF
jgi:exodeoxyribonuclease-3